MLRLVIPGDEAFNEKTSEIVPAGPDTEIDLEHSLASLSKWESEYQKPFLSTVKKTPEEIFSYLKAMVVTPGLDSELLLKLPKTEIDKVQAYIDSPQSATTFGLLPETKGPGETITSELIYYWMVAYNIPWEAQTWHLNRLFSLVKICNIKNSKPKKINQREAAQQRARLNAERRAKLGTKG